MYLSSVLLRVGAWVGAGEASREANRWRCLVSTLTRTCHSSPRHRGSTICLVRSKPSTMTWKSVHPGKKNDFFFFTVFVLSLDVKSCHYSKSVRCPSLHPECVLRHVLLTSLSFCMTPPNPNRYYLAIILSRESTSNGMWTSSVKTLHNYASIINSWKNVLFF